MSEFFFEGLLALNKAVEILPAGGEDLALKLVLFDGAENAESVFAFAVPLDKGASANADFLGDADEAPVLGAIV